MLQGETLILAPGKKFKVRLEIFQHLSIYVFLIQTQVNQIF